MRDAMFSLSHNVSLSETTPIVLAYWYAAEALASSDASASSYRLSEDIGILAVVMAKLKLVQIQRQIGFAYLVIRSNDSAFEQAPKAFNGIGVNHTTHVLTRAVANDFMRQSVRAFTEQAIAGVLIRGDKLDFLFVYGAAHE